MELWRAGWEGLEFNYGATVKRVHQSGSVFCKTPVIDFSVMEVFAISVFGKIYHK